MFDEEERVKETDRDDHYKVCQCVLTVGNSVGVFEFEVGVRSSRKKTGGKQIHSNFVYLWAPYVRLL